MIFRRDFFIRHIDLSTMSEQLTIMCVTYSILAACLESDAYVTCICMAYLITFTQILDGTISFHPFITQFA